MCELKLVFWSFWKILVAICDWIKLFVRVTRKLFPRVRRRQLGGYDILERNSEDSEKCALFGSNESLGCENLGQSDEYSFSDPSNQCNSGNNSSFPEAQHVVCEYRLLKESEAAACNISDENECSSNYSVPQVKSQSTICSVEENSVFSSCVPLPITHINSECSSSSLVSVCNCDDQDNVEKKANDLHTLERQLIESVCEDVSDKIPERVNYLESENNVGIKDEELKQLRYEAAMRWINDGDQWDLIKYIANYGKLRNQRILEARGKQVEMAAHLEFLRDLVCSFRSHH